MYKTLVIPEFPGIIPVSAFLTVPLQMFGANIMVSTINRPFKRGKYGFYMICSKPAVDILALCMVNNYMFLKIFFQA